MKTQTDHGIFDFCGAPFVTSELLLQSDSPGGSAHLETARRIGRSLFAQSLDEAMTETVHPRKLGLYLNSA